MHLTSRLLLSGILLMVSASSSYGMTSSNCFYVLDESSNIAHFQGNPLYEEVTPPIGMPENQRIFIRARNSDPTIYRENAFDENGGSSDPMRQDQLNYQMPTHLEKNEAKDKSWLNNIATSNIVKVAIFASIVGLFAFWLKDDHQTVEHGELKS